MAHQERDVWWCPFPSRYHRTPVWPHHRELRCMQSAGPKRDRHLTSIGAGCADADLADSTVLLCSNGFVELPQLIHHAATSKRMDECQAPAAGGRTESASDQSPASHRGRLRTSEGKLQRQMELPSCTSNFERTTGGWERQRRGKSRTVDGTESSKLGSGWGREGSTN